jgi:hypothetical protein
MKTLSFLLCAALAGATTQAAERVVRRVSPGTVEVITPTSTNLFVRGATNAPFVRGGTNIFFGSSTIQPPGTNVIAGRTNQLNAVGLNNNTPTPTSSVLIGPVFPAPLTNLAPTGRGSGFDGLGPVPAPLVTNAFGQVATNAVTGLEVPAPAVPGTPARTAPLAPPTAPNIPQPTTPSAPPNPNAPPNIPSSANPTPPNTVPLTPPANPTLPPTPPAPPPAAPGGTGTGTR